MHSTIYPGFVSRNRIEGPLYNNQHCYLLIICSSGHLSLTNKFFTSSQRCFWRRSHAGLVAIESLPSLSTTPTTQKVLARAATCPVPLTNLLPEINRPGSSDFSHPEGFFAARGRGSGGLLSKKPYCRGQLLEVNMGWNMGWPDLSAPTFRWMC